MPPDHAGVRAEPDAGDAPAQERPVILVPLFSGSDVGGAAPVLRAVARGRDADVLLVELEQALHAKQTAAPGASLEALRAALASPGMEVRTEHRVGHNLAGMITEAVAEHRPDLLLLTWRRSPEPRPLRARIELDDLLPDVPCDVFVLGLDGPAREPRRIAAVLSGSADAAVREAAVAVAEAVNGTVTFMSVERDDGATRAAALEREVASLPDPARGAVLVVEARSPATGILQNASPQTVDLLVIGTPPSGVIHRLTIGSVTERVARRAAVPVMVVKPRRSAARSTLSRLADGLLDRFPALDEATKVAVYRSVRTAARGNLDFDVMMALAAAIAALGLLLNSPAVVIGGMLVAPLMAPLVALGLGVVQGDARLLRLSTLTALRGSVLSVAIAALSAIVIPNASLTTEVLARTSPSLLDLGVAFAAGAAGGYAISREHLSAALPGVAIAAALVPPLAAAGVALALLDPVAAGGAALLFAANFVAIAAAAGAVFFIVGFRPEPEHAPRLKLFTRGFTALALLAIAIAVPLTWLTVESVRAATIDREARAELDAAVLELPGVRWTRLETERSQDGALRLIVDMESAEPLEPAQVARLEARLETRLEQPVDLAVRLFQVTEIHGTQPSPVAPAPATPTTPASGGP